jgi:hypothetical protein
MTIRIRFAVYPRRTTGRNGSAYKGALSLLRRLGFREHE